MEEVYWVLMSQKVGDLDEAWTCDEDEDRSWAGEVALREEKWQLVRDARLGDGEGDLWRMDRALDSSYRV